jgi:hypothetical protein
MKARDTILRSALVAALVLVAGLLLAPRPARGDVVPPPTPRDECLGHDAGAACGPRILHIANEPAGVCRDRVTRRPRDPRDPDAGVLEAHSLECLPVPDGSPASVAPAADARPSVVEPKPVSPRSTVEPAVSLPFTVDPAPAVSASSGVPAPGPRRSGGSCTMPAAPGGRGALLIVVALAVWVARRRA